MGYLNKQLLNTNSVLIGIVYACLSFICATSGMYCPESCECTLSSDGNVRAVCRLGNHDEYTAVTRLPNNTTELECVVQGRLKEDALHLKYLSQLRNLVIRPKAQTSYFIAEQTAMNSDISRSDLLQNLSSLTSLAINIPIRSVSDRLLHPVRNLEVLDLSYSYMDLQGSLASFLSELSGRHLHTLNLTAYQRRQTQMPPEPILLRDHIFASLQKFPIKVLDLMENEMVALQAGISVYLPELEILRIGSRRLIYLLPTRPYEQACFNTELLWHPTLREITASFPVVSFSVYSRTKRLASETPNAATNLGLHDNKCEAKVLKHPDNVSCSMANCLCEGVIHIPCGRIQNITLSDFLDITGGCHEHVRFPLAPQLERFTLKNLILLGMSGSNKTLKVVMDDVKVCVNPNNRLRYIDMSTQITKNGRAKFIANVSLTGFRKVEFCNMQGNAVFVTPQIRLFSDMPVLRVLLLGGNGADLSMWEDLDFLHVVSLESLDLKSCFLRNIPPLAFSKLEKL